MSATWTPHQLLHPGNVAWSHSRGDGSPAPDATFAWGEPLIGFADVWLAGSPDGPAEASLHVSPRAAAEQRRRIVQELVDAFPVMTLEVSRQDVALVEVLAAAGFREQEGPWFAQLWRDLRDTSDLDQHAVPAGYAIRSVDVHDADEVLARVEVHRRAWAPSRIKGLLGLEVSGDEPGSSYSADKHRAVVGAQGYRPELDLVAVDADGGFAAYALGWLDDRTKSLLFEPVGTDPAHSGRGLARALCAQMLHVAGRLGAEEAVVGPRGDPGYPLPRRVYEGLGMREVAQFVSMSSAQQ
ncbi:MAG: GNAT family N-acetyltransferase [Nocardioides sp.]